MRSNTSREGGLLPVGISESSREYFTGFFFFHSFFDWKVMDHFCTYTEVVLCLSKHLTLNLLPFSFGDFSSVLFSFTSGWSRSECRDTKGSVGEREGEPWRRGDQEQLWDVLGVELGNPVWRTLWPDSFSSWQELGRSCVPAQRGIHWGRGEQWLKNGPFGPTPTLLPGSLESSRGLLFSLYPRVCCVVRPSVKCLLGKWLSLTIIFTVKELMEKLAWLFFDWLAH